MNFKFEIKPVKINPAPFKEATAGVCQANDESEKLACAARLSTYKMKTVDGQRLHGDELGEAYRLARKMDRKGWLTDSDREWCEVNNISL